MVNRDYRLWVILFSNFFLLILIVKINEYLSKWGIHIELFSLFILFSTLYLRLRHGIIVTILTAILLEVFYPSKFGILLSLFILTYGIIVVFRQRIRREKAIHLITVAFGSNCLIFVIFSLIVGINSLGSWVYWVNCLSNLLISQFILILTTGIYIKLQTQLLYNQGIDIAGELQEV